VVAAVGGRLLSVYDGRYEYKLHVWNASSVGAHAYPPLWACLWTYPSLREALGAAFPPDSALLDAPRALLRVQVRGRGFRRTADGVHVLSQLLATEVVTHLPRHLPWEPSLLPMVPAKLPEGVHPGRPADRLRDVLADQAAVMASGLLDPLPC
jgi:hypothetical protein